ncbi:MFS transporter [Nakamurella endophytica]|uniref:MFS transporter n=1 Tax=Nakamurella endophytica TaxID=1748367 RepID=A0A917WDB9_9ACTN|nr:MFS transporter [Nakamurella endophytica]GGL92442.1 MFS transporter [Nakamurella endophytica]
MGGRLLELVTPSRLGPGFRWLLPSSWVSNLGDGIALAAGPLLVRSLTDNAVLVASAATLQWLPPLLFAAVAGALADRWDRRRIVVTVDLCRTAVLAGLTVVVLLGQATVAVVLAFLFVLATAEVFADTTTQTLLPMLVRREDLAVANFRLQTGFVTVNQLAGPPLGAALFAAGAAWPFGTQAALVALAVGLVARIRLPRHGPGGGPPTKLHHDIAEGVRWAVRHPAVRTLVVTIAIFNVTFGAAWSVLVLYATERLRLGAVGFGLITTVGAVGGLVGTVCYGWLTRRVSLGDLLRVGLIVETCTHLLLALTTTAWVALPVFFVFGAHAFVWGTTSVTVRQRAVPGRLQGRIGSVNMVGTYGGLVVGSSLGGPLAEHWGVTAPFWFAFGGSAVFVVLIWRQLRHVSHGDRSADPVERDGDARAAPAG